MHHHFPYFIRRFGKTMEDVYTTEGKSQLLNSLQWKPLAPSYLLSALQAELANLDSIYTSYKPLILTVTQQLKREPSLNGMSPFSKCTMRSLLPFLGDALSWLMQTATTRDVRDIKKRVNQLIETQTQQQETLVHIISIPNITRYAIQFNREHINAVIEVAERTHNNITTLFIIKFNIHCIN